MIHVTLNCSSPFVGYSIKTADCENRLMLEDADKYLTAIGKRLFSVSGSQYLLGNFSGKEYFHALDLGVDSFDENNRRIYTNIAFVGDNEKDANAVDRIAVYAILQKERFYVEFSKLIILERSGYRVRFDELTAYLNRFYADVSVDNNSARVRNIVSAATSKGEEEKIKLIVYEEGCDWNYFTYQVKQKDLKRAKFELKQEDINDIKAEVRITQKNSSDAVTQETDTKEDQTKPETAPKKERIKEESLQLRAEQIKADERIQKAMAEIAKLQRHAEEVAEENANLQNENCALKNQAKKIRKEMNDEVAKMKKQIVRYKYSLCISAALLAVSIVLCGYFYLYT